MTRRRPAKATTYVQTALRLLRTLPEVSVGQVAYVVHKRPTSPSDFSFAVDRALSESGQFRRASFIGADQFNILRWKGAGQ